MLLLLFMLLLLPRSIVQYIALSLGSPNIMDYVSTCYHYIYLFLKTGMVSAIVGYQKDEQPQREKTT